MTKRNTGEGGWDLSQLGLTNHALRGTCPACRAYLHPFCDTCFGCGHERGSALPDIAEQHAVVAGAPLQVLLAGKGFLAEVARGRGITAASGDGERQALWNLNRRTEQAFNTWHGQGMERLNYLGGLEYRQQPEYCFLRWENAVLVVDGERSRERIASIVPSRILGASAHLTSDEVLGGAMVGFVGGPGAFLRSIPPTQGGILKLVFADDASIWRVVLLGNRTGLTDRRGDFSNFQTLAELVGYPAFHQSVEQEWQLGPVAYATALGFGAAAQDGGDRADTKTCPRCAEVIKAAAVACRFCRYEYAAPTPARPAATDGDGNQPSVTTAHEAAVQFQVTYERIEDVTNDDLSRALHSGQDLARALASWAMEAGPRLKDYRATMRACRGFDVGADELLDLIDDALAAYEVALPALAEGRTVGQGLLQQAASAWREVQEAVATSARR